MEKRYYSTRHKKYNRKRKEEKSAFLMRLNISLGICILTIGFYKLNNDFSNNLTNVYKELVGGNISFSQIEDSISSISNLGLNAVSAYSGNNSIVLDKSVTDYINNTEDNYILNNKTAVSP
ncbi:MAG: hypothetical protein ACI4VF_02600 [Lachnospirales bacterium]